MYEKHLTLVGTILAIVTGNIHHYREIREAIETLIETHYSEAYRELLIFEVRDLT